MVAPTKSTTIKAMSAMDTITQNNILSSVIAKKNPLVRLLSIQMISVLEWLGGYRIFQKPSSLSLARIVR